MAPTGAQGEDQWGAQGDHGVLGERSWVPKGPKRAQGQPIDPWVLRFVRKLLVEVVLIVLVVGFAGFSFKVVAVACGACVVGVVGIGGGVIDYLVVALVASCC